MKSIPTAALCCALALLSACGSSRPSPRASSTAAASAIPAAPDEAVWHLRAGLNVAALSCRVRGRVHVHAAYGRLLSRHRTLLANAYAAERRRHGAGLDRHETRLYNRFSNQRQPERWCREAAAVAIRAADMSSPELARSAGSLLGEI